MDLKKTFLNYIRQYPFLKQFIKFCIVGGAAALINFAILYSLTEWLKIWYLISSILGFIVSAIFNFTINKLWTFRNQEKGRQVIKQAVKFAIVVTSSLIINTLIIYALTEWVGFDYRLSWVFASGIVTFWNFGFNRLWTFKHHNQYEKEKLPILGKEDYKGS